MKFESLRNDPQKAKRVAKVMKYMGHPARLRIVELLLTKKKLTVSQIYEAVEISQSNASQHLRILEQAEILESERNGTSILYSVNKEGVDKLLRCAYRCVSGD